MTRSATVIGAGIVGLSCAASLQRRGFRVTVIDRGEPGAGCSAGNAGMIQTGSIAPLAMPGILRQAPAMLFDPQGALVVRRAFLLRTLPWFARFVASARPGRVAHIAATLHALLSQARQAHERLLAESQAEDLFVDRGELYVFRDPAARAKLAPKFALYERHGIACRELDAAGLREAEPQLAADYRYGYYLPGSGYVSDPLRLSQRIAAGLAARGATLLKAAITSVHRESAGRIRLDGSNGTLRCDTLVIAAGSASSRLAAQLGTNLPIAPMRGYHLMVPARELSLAGPLIDGEMNIAATPMLDGIRLAGTLEFTGHDSAPDWRRADMLLPLAARLLPRLASGADARWFGDRPGTPDSLPIIGPAGDAGDVWLACGHGTLGLTLGPLTGELLACGLVGQTPPLDLSPLSPRRFRLRHASS